MTRRPSMSDDSGPPRLDPPGAAAAAGSISDAVIGEEFDRTIRRELDIEVLLRRALEFLLAHGGPTNAAVFLPSTSGDFSLGAYVNYSCPKDTAEVLLDHLANSVAPHLQDAEGVLNLSSPAGHDEFLADTAAWLSDAEVLAFSCRHDGECLAVFMLFRPRHIPFPEPFVGMLPIVARRFGAQVARVISIHHRHLPREQWGAPGDPRDASDEDGGLAA